MREHGEGSPAPCRVAACHFDKMLSSRIWHGRFTWEAFHKVRERFPLQRPKLRLNYQEFQGYAVL